MNIDFVEMIKKYREEHFCSQEDFAKMIGVSYVSVNRWENGHFAPTLKAKKKLCALFKKEGMIDE